MAQQQTFSGKHLEEIQILILLMIISMTKKNAAELREQSDIASNA
tara:strand:- start:199 stop:333 length:135 start_codon:yes stop_codon:yes gene_type:complete